MKVTRPQKITQPAHSDHRLNTDRLQEFLAIADEGSISAAARTLNVPRATLSRRLSALEGNLGVRLLHRRTNRLILTDAGVELRMRAQRILADVDATWHAVRRLDDTPRGLLRVSITGPHYADLFTDFLRDFPDIRLEIQSTTRHVDLLSEGVDVAIRIGEVKDQNLIARHIHTDRLVAAASPAYLEHFRQPKVPDDLAGHNCIAGFAGEWTPARSWPLLSGQTVPIGGRLSANELALVMNAALKGIGIALIPSAVGAPHFRSNKLVPVLVETVGKAIPISLVYSDREYIDPKVRIFIDRAIKAVTSEMPKPYDFETG